MTCEVLRYGTGHVTLLLLMMMMMLLLNFQLLLLECRVRWRRVKLVSEDGLERRFVVDEILGVVVMGGAERRPVVVLFLLLGRTGGADGDSTGADGGSGDAVPLRLRGWTRGQLQQQLLMVLLLLLLLLF